MSSKATQVIDAPGDAGHGRPPDRARQVSGKQFLDRDTESALARAWREQGDVEARNRLVMAYLPLALRHARKYGKSLSQYEDLKQVATLGLMDAADRFDPDLGWRFSTYAVWWVRAQVQEAARSERSLVRTPRRHTGNQNPETVRNALESAAIDLSSYGVDRNDPAVRKEAARRLDMTMPQFEAAMAVMTGPDMSLNQSLGRDPEDASEWLEKIIDPVGSPEDLLLLLNRDEFFTVLINSALIKLRPRERTIIEKRFLSDESPATLRELSEDIGVSPERVRQIEGVAIRKMQKLIANAMKEHRTRFQDLIDP